jgi:hypothetical protein
MSKAAELAALIGSQTALSNRNLIINGAMQVAQRSTSETNFTGSAFKTVDRVRSNLSGGGTFDQEQSTDVPSGEGFINSLKTTVNTVDSSIAAGDYYALEFPLEGQNVNSISGFGTSGAKNLTLSFFVKSSVTGDYSVSFQNGVFDTSYVSKYTISSANTWEKKTISITAKTDGTWVTTNAQGVRIWFSLGTGSTFSTSSEQTYQSGNYVNLTGTTQWISNAGATFYITGVQLEVGDTATPFEHEDFGTTLRKCQRYYYKVSQVFGVGFGNTNAVAQVELPFPVQMRTNPTAIDTTGTAANYEVRVTENDRASTSVPTLVADNYGSKDVGYVFFNITAGHITAGGVGFCRAAANDTGAYIAFQGEL